MTKITTVNNDTQKFILSQLKHHEWCSFTDMKPAGIASNTYSYHLKQLISGGWVVKAEQGYTLGTKGLAYAARNQEDAAIRMQPNVEVVLLVQDGYGKVALHKRAEQPYIGYWELPVQPMAVADMTVEDAGIWAAKRLLKYVPGTVKHAGAGYIRLFKGKHALTTTLVHVVRFTVESLDLAQEYQWFDPLEVPALVPGVEQLIARAFFGDEFFFEQYSFQLVTQQALL